MSTTRRAFLRSAALGALALPSWGMSRERAGELQFYRIFFDERRPQALAFADTARGLGARMHAISGDVDDPCYDDLKHRWRVAKSPIAGMTDFRVLFLVQIMAIDVGLQSILRIHHGGCAQASSRDIACGCAAARLVMGLNSRSAVAIRGGDNLCPVNMRAVDSRALVTWVIA